MEEPIIDSANEESGLLQEIMIFVILLLLILFLPNGKSGRKYWCDRVTMVNEYIARAEKALASATTRDQIQLAKEQIMDSHATLKRIEAEARQQGIPQGWLECK